MASSRFVYVTYIRTTPEKLWQALIDPDFTRRFWLETWQESAWETGVPWRMLSPDGRVHFTGEVLECVPGKRLVRTWHCETMPEARAEGPSRVTLELEPVGDSVKLTFIQENDTPDSKTVRMASEGWPLILASLKSLLETGEPLEATRHWPAGR
jgi:uncharacterized protein YndB with AHSA1/START domain